MSNSMGKWLRDAFFVVCGNAILAFGVACFAVPINLIVGGASGLGLIISHFVPLKLATCVFMINMIMLTLGYVVLGKKFAAGTVVSSFMFPFFLGLFQNIDALKNGLTNDMLLSTIYAGLFIGLGIGIVLRLGYSTGGMDIPPILLNKKLGIPVAVGINVLDTLILLGQSFTASIEGILYGILTVLITTIVLDRVIVIGEKNLEVFIISEHYEEIAEVIFDEIDRGCTFINVTTGYLGKDQKAVMSVMNARQYAKANEIVSKVDPLAFFIVSEIRSVKGRGFTLPNIARDREKIY